VSHVLDEQPSGSIKLAAILEVLYCGDERVGIVDSPDSAGGSAEFRLDEEGKWLGLAQLGFEADNPGWRMRNSDLVKELGE
jgi:hypothetical protein